ncbi:Spermidine synthase protein [Dioscorea alata]|uniref:Spermidine synthase protein n=1 Tax=Dioscorea alata TaxID=55571 RepID=A0ACB7UIT1_DIOAL|nr:Spermidine synthase protein [Dioscorea alata]
MEAEAVVKRVREDGTEDNGAGGVLSIVEDGKTVDCISTVIPGWFSEMSPMWPGKITISKCDGVETHHQLIEGSCLFTVAQLFFD